MEKFQQQFIEQLIATSIWEWIAVIFAVSYILLAIKESIWCWPAAFFSTAIYTYLFFDVNLYMESFLNLYYLVMAVYGWNQWHKKSQDSEQKKIIRWSLEKHFILIVITFIIIFITAYLLESYTDQDFALLDSYTSWFAVLATYMVTQKVLENWFYWIVIDSLTIYLYVSKGFALSAVLFFCYIILASIGWVVWKKHYEQQSASAA